MDYAWSQTAPRPRVRCRFAALVAITALAALSACSSGAGSDSSIATFCTKSQADESIFSAAGPTATDSSQALAAFEDLTNIAPSEINADMTTILTFLKTSSTGTPDPAQAAAVTAASQRVVQFFKDKCHVDLADTEGSSFSAVGSSISN